MYCVPCTSSTQRTLTRPINGANQKARNIYSHGSLVRFSVETCQTHSKTQHTHCAGLHVTPQHSSASGNIHNTLTALDCTLLHSTPVPQATDDQRGKTREHTHFDETRHEVAAAPVHRAPCCRVCQCCVLMEKTQRRAQKHKRTHKRERRDLAGLQTRTGTGPETTATPTCRPCPAKSPR